MDGSFYELVLDNIPHGIYILDREGFYVYVNRTYVNFLGATKKDLLYTDVHDFLKRKQIQFCISDLVKKEKREIYMIQEVQRAEGFQLKSFRQLVLSMPIFDDDGEVEFVIAFCTPIEKLNKLYAEAEKNGLINSIGQKSDYDFRYKEIVAESESMQYVLKMAEMIAKTETTVLVSGESGTGKEVVTQFIHDSSLRADKRLVVVNCASLPEHLLEAELFGYEKGAFTGALNTGKKGMIEEADGGTLFLDEINSLPISLQGKLLRAIETKTIQRIGSTKTIKVDFRLICATNENLEKAVEDRKFRADLFYRINVIPMYIPPLRERVADIYYLAMYFLEFYNKRYEKTKRFSENTIKMMQEYEWPGNVRELKNFVERTVVMTTGVYIEVPDIEGIASSARSIDYTNPGDKKEPAMAVSESHEMSGVTVRFDENLTLKEYLDKCESEYIKYALEKCRSTYEAAQFLGTSQSSIMRRKKKYINDEI